MLLKEKEDRSQVNNNKGDDGDDGDTDDDDDKVDNTGCFFFIDDPIQRRNSPTTTPQGFSKESIKNTMVKRPYMFVIYDYYYLCVCYYYYYDCNIIP